MPERALLLFGADRIVTMDQQRRVLGPGHAIAIADGLITDVSLEADVRSRTPAADVLDVGGGWITPGMINAHQHMTGDRLARCTIPDDLVPGAAIFEWAVPLHEHHTGDDDELSATASSIESLTNGVTFAVEAGTVAHPTRAAAGMRAAGMRGTVGTWGWDIEHGPFTAPVDEVLDRQRSVLDAFPPDGGVAGWVTLVGHDLMSDELLARASALARERGTSLTFHISPSTSDAIQWTARAGARPLVHFDRLGALGPHVLLAHAVHLDDDEIAAVLATRTAIASCPWAYLRLGQGATVRGRHAEIAERGGRIALGCDSENAGDQLDVLRAAALFAGIAKDARIDPTRFGAREAFELATIAGAQAIGRGGDLGSIEVGKRADLVVHDTKGANWSPPGDDPYLQLVWGTDGRSVRHVVVGGDVVIRERRSTKVDTDALRSHLKAARAGLLARAGIVGS